MSIIMPAVRYSTPRKVRIMCKVVSLHVLLPMNRKLVQLQLLY